MFQWTSVSFVIQNSTLLSPLSVSTRGTLSAQRSASSRHQNLHLKHSHLEVKSSLSIQLLIPALPSQQKKLHQSCYCHLRGTGKGGRVMQQEHKLGRAALDRYDGGKMVDLLGASPYNKARLKNVHVHQYLRAGFQGNKHKISIKGQTFASKCTFFGMVLHRVVQWRKIKNSKN